ncbi:MAG: hypothetical protein JO168_07355 [Solirubrobacterales bacterium]|nr:hypothetical protein [Solirubrobacterales bacterium]
MAVSALAERAHERDNLFSRRLVSGVLLALVARWTASVMAGHGRRRAAVAGGVHQHGFR